MLRNHLFDSGTWKSVAFEFPVIYVGTLANDATIGISRYIQNLLSASLHVYRYDLSKFELQKKEVSNYYSLLSSDDTFCTTHQVLGLSEWYQKNPNTTAFVMNGQFLKNEIRPQLRILVTNFERLLSQDKLFPIGNLHASRRAAEIADVLIVSQTPDEANLKAMEEDLKPFLKSNTPVFFIKNSNQSLGVFNSVDKIEFISDRHNFERLILNVLPNANLDSE